MCCNSYANMPSGRGRWLTRWYAVATYLAAFSEAAAALTSVRCRLLAEPSQRVSHADLFKRCVRDTAYNEENNQTLCLPVCERPLYLEPGLKGKSYARAVSQRRDPDCEAPLTSDDIFGEAQA